MQGHCSPDLMMTDGAGEEYQGALHELIIAAPVLLPTPRPGPGLRCRSSTKQKWNLTRKGFAGHCFKGCRGCVRDNPRAGTVKKRVCLVRHLASRLTFLLSESPNVEKPSTSYMFFQNKLACASRRISKPKLTGERSGHCPANDYRFSGTIYLCLFVLS